jgi:hypothetical protein
LWLSSKPKELIPNFFPLRKNITILALNIKHALFIPVLGIYQDCIEIKTDLLGVLFIASGKGSNGANLGFEQKLW